MFFFEIYTTNGHFHPCMSQCSRYLFMPGWCWRIFLQSSCLERRYHLKSPPPPSHSGLRSSEPCYYQEKNTSIHSISSHLSPTPSWQGYFTSPTTVHLSHILLPVPSYSCFCLFKEITTYSPPPPFFLFALTKVVICPAWEKKQQEKKKVRAAWK